MNLLTLYPTQSCNFRCTYCPMKKWLYPYNPEDTEFNALRNSTIFKWFDKFCPPREWIIEISGGEPGMYPEIKELIEGLNERGYYGIIKTNGTLFIPKSDNFRRIATWHKSCDSNNPPKYYDLINIIKNPDDCWKDKQSYCTGKNIPYHLSMFRDYSLPLSARIAHEDNKVNTFITRWTVVYSSGSMSKCYSSEPLTGNVIKEMHPPVQSLVGSQCPRCVSVKGVEMFITDDVKRKLEEKNHE